MVSVSVTVSAKTIGQFGFWFRYRTKTKIVVSVVHYVSVLHSTILYCKPLRSHKLRWEVCKAAYLLPILNRLRWLLYEPAFKIYSKAKHMQGIPLIWKKSTNQVNKWVLKSKVKGNGNSLLESEPYKWWTASFWRKKSRVISMPAVPKWTSNVKKVVKWGQ